jgi:hypothetical protein
MVDTADSAAPAGKGSPLGGLKVLAILLNLPLALVAGLWYLVARSVPAVLAACCFAVGVVIALSYLSALGRRSAPQKRPPSAALKALVQLFIWVPAATNLLMLVFVLRH